MLKKIASSTLSILIVGLSMIGNRVFAADLSSGCAPEPRTYYCPEDCPRVSEIDRYYACMRTTTAYRTIPGISELYEERYEHDLELVRDAENTLSSPGTPRFETNTNTRISDDDCSVLPPRCATASNRAITLVNEFSRASGIYDEASQAYCAALLGINVNEFCADEFRIQGKTNCADLSDQQAEIYRRALPQYQATISGIAVQGSAIREACNWEPR